MEINFIAGGLAGSFLGGLHFCPAFEYWKQAVVAGFPLKTPFPLRTWFSSVVFTPSRPASPRELPFPHFQIKKRDSEA